MMTYVQFSNPPPQKRKNLKQTIFSRPKAQTMLTLLKQAQCLFTTAYPPPSPQKNINPSITSWQRLTNLYHPRYPTRKKSEVVTSSLRTPVTFHTSSSDIFCDRGVLCMWKTGTLSYEEFENGLLDFLERARKVGDPWNLEISKVQFFLTKLMFSQQERLIGGRLFSF